MDLPPVVIAKVQQQIPRLSDFLQSRTVSRRWWQTSFAVVKQWIRIWNEHGKSYGSLRWTIPIPIQVFQSGIRKQRKRVNQMVNHNLKRKRNAELTIIVTSRGLGQLFQKQDQLDRDEQWVLAQRQLGKRGRIELTDF